VLGTRQAIQWRKGTAASEDDAALDEKVTVDKAGG